MCASEIWDGRKEGHLINLFFPAGKRGKILPPFLLPYFTKCLQYIPTQNYSRKMSWEILFNGTAFFPTNSWNKTFFSLLIEAKSTEKFLVLFLPVGRPRKSLFLSERFSEERDTSSLSFSVLCVLCVAGREWDGGGVLFVRTRRWALLPNHAAFSDKKNWLLCRHPYKLHLGYYFPGNVTKCML